MRPVVAPGGPRFISASQITLFREADAGCERKWGFKYIAGLYEESGAAALLGTEVDDTQLQPYLRDGRPIDYARESGYVAQPALEYLPKPGSCELSVQQEIRLPSLTGEPFALTGYIDLWEPEGGEADACAECGSLQFNTPSGRVCSNGHGGARLLVRIPKVTDFKTTGNWKYAKTPEALLTDVQAMIYASWAMLVTGADAVDLEWLYLSTKKPYRAEPRRVRITSEHATGQIVKILETARELYLLREAAPDPLSLKPNPEACGKFPPKGCPHQSKCNLSPTQILQSKFAAHRHRSLPVMTQQLSLVERMKAKQLAANGGAPPAAAPPPPDKAAALPSSAHAVDTSGPIVPYYAKGGIPVANIPSHVVGINPPESALPPAPPVGAVEAPAQTYVTPSGVPGGLPVPGSLQSGEKPKRGPGRPKKETSTDGGVITTTLGATVNGGDFSCLETVSVTWAREKFSPVSYNDFDIGPFEATGSVRAGESIGEAMARIYAELVIFAEAARAAKALSYRATLEAMGSSR